MADPDIDESLDLADHVRRRRSEYVEYQLAVEVVFVGRDEGRGILGQLHREASGQADLLAGSPDRQAFVPELLIGRTHDAPGAS